jgi:two-component system LytT family response regulator
VPSIRVVIADDDQLSSRHLGRLLERFPQLDVVGVAQDGEQARELVDRLLPDLLFIDIEMQKLSGFQVLRAIRHKPLVIIVTAHREYSHLVIETDAIYCLRKPFDAAEVQKMMDKIDSIVAIVGGLGSYVGGA